MQDAGTALLCCSGAWCGDSTTVQLPNLPNRRGTMWDQYKKTLAGMQTVILLVTLLVFAWSHLWTLAAVFFAVMQTTSALGAMWGYRLKRKLQPHAYGPSLPRA